MNFLRLHDPLLTVHFENDEIVVINKPFGIDTHTNDSKVGNADLIQHGLIELFESQLKTKLHIVHRLDRTTTGVIVFAKSLESAKKYQGFFRNREAKKRYLFVTDRRSSKNELSSSREIVRNGVALEASTNFYRLERTERFELWQASPLTGRNHQIRIHAADVGLPLLGDTKYGGSSFPFLCLHNQRLEFPNGMSFEAPPPKYFTELELLKDTQLAKLYFELDRRQRLFGASLDADQCLRLIHLRKTPDDSGLSLDQLGQTLSLSWSRNGWLESDEAHFRHLSAYLGKKLVVQFAGAQREAPRGPAEEEISWAGCESRIKHEFRSSSGLSQGLYLDQRLQRNWVAENSQHRTVVNLFSYTCGFGVAAACGGASEVISVDANKKALGWGRRNFELNGLDPGKHKFLCRDSTVFLEQCVAKEQKFDLIICDAPAFARGEKGVFKIEASLEPLLRNCLSCLNDGGDLLFSTRSERLFVDDIRKALLKIQGALDLKSLEINCIQPGLDFELPGERPTLKSFLVRKSASP